MVIVITLSMVGAGTYFVFADLSPTPSSICEPRNFTQCGFKATTHDVALIEPFATVDQSIAVPFSVSVPPGEQANQYTYVFGDGSSNVTPADTTTHTYSQPGTYLAQVEVNVGGKLHDNNLSLVQVRVASLLQTSSVGNLPCVDGVILKNSTPGVSWIPPSAVLQPNGSVTVQGYYSCSPTNPAWRELPPSIVAPPGATILSQNRSSTNATASLGFPLPGTYLVTFSGGSVRLGNSGLPSIDPATYTWTVFVAVRNTHAGVFGPSAATSPHPGTMIVYEEAPGGARTEDPAIAYDATSYEPILNVYQTLITYNGSQVGPTWQSFEPSLATCVPGSPQCEQLYGNSLVDGYNYTFVINGASQFYDPVTGSHWGVYPSDIVFSVARTLGFSTLPTVMSNNGWILAQALLGRGNGSWSPVHFTYNNTPQNIFGSMTVNDTADGFCTHAMMTDDHGCVTFHVDGQGLNWPYFLELIADPLGGSIVPCGWFSAPAQAAGIPYWTSGNVTSPGDHPCAMPGQGMGAPVSQMPPTGWDQWEEMGSGATGRYVGNIQYRMVGSGPYYLSEYSIGISYALSANPAYVQNPYCIWKGCPPAPNTYAKTVEVTWGSDQTQGEQELSAGIADMASIPESDMSLVFNLVASGKVTAVTYPTLTTSFIVMNMDIDSFVSSGYPTNVPSDFLSYLGVRQFLVHSYPYATIERTVYTANGVEEAVPYGGAIPRYLDGYYPSNITWPTGDPCTNSSNPSCATYWWSQLRNSSSVYYDPEAGNCSRSSPCQFTALIGVPGAEQWANEITNLTGGAMLLNPGAYTEGMSFGPPTQVAMYASGWAPDFPDPADYVDILYAENSTLTWSAAFAQALYTPQFSNAACIPASDWPAYSNVAIALQQECQGTAYKAMNVILSLASCAPAGTNRADLYAAAEQIASKLALSVYTGQEVETEAAASWIGINSLDTNPTIGGSGDFQFFTIQGNDIVGSAST